MGGVGDCAAADDEKRKIRLHNINNQSIRDLTR
jgi:hypothetical protein